MNGSRCRHGAILVPFGDDMKFQNAEKQYSNMDRLMKEVNGNASLGINLQYVGKGKKKRYWYIINTFR